MTPSRVLGVCLLIGCVMIGSGPGSRSGWAEGPGGTEGLVGEDVGGAQEGSDAGNGGKMAPNCRAEIKQLCQGVEPGGGRMRACLKENEGKLSPACRQQVGAHRERAKERRQQLKAACEGDVKRLCPNVEPGGGRIGGCLKAHANELSPGCAQAIEQRRQGRGGRSQPAQPAEPTR